MRRSWIVERLRAERGRNDTIGEIAAPFDVSR
jgi:hypothetical protein